MKKLSLAAAGLLALAGSVQAAPVLMSPQWAAEACTAWNQNPTLVNELGKKWVKNNGGKGYKAIIMYRTQCGKSNAVELKIADQNGRAECVYGGKQIDMTPNFSVDYEMHATTNDWGEMGRGEYGPMHAMIFGDLKFSGPKFEAMSVMGPFGQFLLLVGKVPGDTSACPQ